MAPLNVNVIFCSGCSQKIENKQFLTCSNCSKHYDIDCAKVSEKRFYSTMVDYKNTWKCQKCKGTANTPNKNEVQPTAATSNKSSCSSNVTLRSRTNIKKNPSSTVSPGSLLEQSTETELVTELRLMREEMKAAREEMQEFRSVITGLTAAINTINSRIDEVEARLEAVEHHQCSGPAREVSSLEDAITELKLELNDRDQELLSNDIEIAGLPEEKGERSIHLALTVATKLGVNLDERDVVSAERAGPVRREEDGGARPRPLVVRLTRRTHRDQLLAAARVRRGATTDGLGLEAGAQRFHVNERLTRTNRQLFYKARGESLRAHWKYVWTRDGKIYARKENGSPRVRLRSEDQLANVFGH